MALTLNELEAQWTLAGETEVGTRHGRLRTDVRFPGMGLLNKRQMMRRTGDLHILENCPHFRSAFAVSTAFDEPREAVCNAGGAVR